MIFMKFLKAQSSVEALMILGVALIFIIPLVMIFYSSTALRLQTLNQLEAKAMVQQISDTAGEVWYEGEGSRRTILVNYPSGTTDISFNLGRDVVITLDDNMGGETRILVVSPAPVMNNYAILGTGDIRQDVNYLKNPSGQLNPGGQILVIRNERDYVNVVRFVPGVDY